MTKRYSIKEPIPEIKDASDRLSEAADAYLAGVYDRAEELFRETNESADARKIWHWLNPDWGPNQNDLDRNVRNWHPKEDTHWVPKALRDGLKSMIPDKVKNAVLTRDGYRCRYCGMLVISAYIRKLIRCLDEDGEILKVEEGIFAVGESPAVPWIHNDVVNEHAALQCMWLQYDHVVPWSHGGRSDEKNVVVSCALCNFGKAEFTLAQLEIADPRDRDPVPCEWDGLERLYKKKGVRRRV